MSTAQKEEAKKMNLGRLEKIDLRDIWRTEDQDFTQWLAREENIALLADTLGLELEIEAQEKEVGPFRADILCKDQHGSWVLIENQLERTDHKHLGELIAYAAGLKAVNIIWIAATFTDEHRAELERATLAFALYLGSPGRNPTEHDTIILREYWYGGRYRF